eukprot:9032519-Pyramimonas_sp.AAC.1
MWFRLYGRGPLAAPAPKPAAGPPVSAGADCVVPSIFGASLIWTRGLPRPANVGTTSCVFACGWLESAFALAPLRPSRTPGPAGCGEPRRSSAWHVTRPARPALWITADSGLVGVKGPGCKSWLQ